MPWSSHVQHESLLTMFAFPLVCEMWYIAEKSGKAWGYTEINKSVAYFFIEHQNPLAIIQAVELLWRINRSCWRFTSRFDYNTTRQIPPRARLNEVTSSIHANSLNSDLSSLPERKHQCGRPIIVTLGDIIQLYKFHCWQRRHWNSLRFSKGWLWSGPPSAGVRRNHHRLQPPTHGKLNCPSLKLFIFRLPSNEF